MIDDGLTHYVEYTGSCQCMECDLAIHSLIHKFKFQVSSFNLFEQQILSYYISAHI